jgi:UDP-2,4-diacetamido-2,4,6-trideoxy-beta-L-altropyranose hydrolase
MRYDASPEIGAGHASRCQALAAALERYGWRVKIATQTPSPDGRDVIALSGGAADEATILCRCITEGCDLLVVDHYERGQEFERACRPWARRILAIDDLCDRPHDVDFLLDHMPARKRADYRFAPDTATVTFLGGDFALLRENFVRHRHSRRSSGSATTIFVGFGGVDAGGLTARTLNELRALGASEHVVAVLGRHAPSLGEISKAVEGQRVVQLLIEPPDMAAVMAQCDMAIGAGGVSALERCALGLASIAVVAVDNQRETVCALADRGAVVPVESPGEAGFQAALKNALQELRSRRPAMAASALAVCDGLGALRVAAAVGGPALRDGSRVGFRPVVAADSDALLRWQQLPEIRRYSRNPNPPTAAGHADWLKKKLADPARVFEIAHRGGIALGVLRLDCRTASDALASPQYEVSIYVLPEAQGIGAGRAMLEFARRAVPWAELIAQVLPENTASHCLFAACGYRRQGETYIHEPMKQAV